MRVKLTINQVLDGSVHFAGADLDLDELLAQELIRRGRANPVDEPASTADEKPAVRKQRKPALLREEMEK